MYHGQRVATSVLWDANWLETQIGSRDRYATLFKTVYSQRQASFLYYVSPPLSKSSENVDSCTKESDHSKALQEEHVASPQMIPLNEEENEKPIDRWKRCTFKLKLDVSFTHYSRSTVRVAPFPLFCSHPCGGEHSSCPQRWAPSSTWEDALRGAACCALGGLFHGSLLMTKKRTSLVVSANYQVRNLTH